MLWILRDRIHVTGMSCRPDTWIYVTGSRIASKGKIIESITPEKFHLVEKIQQNSYKKSSDLIKKRHIQKFDELINKNKVTQSATNITDKKKWVINMSSHILATMEDALKDLEKEEADTICTK